jgi:hypothetical protein
MRKSKTHFEQVSLERVKKVIAVRAGGGKTEVSPVIRREMVKDDLVGAIKPKRPGVKS